MRALNAILSIIGINVIVIAIVTGCFLCVKGCVRSCSAQDVELITVQGLIAECDRCKHDERKLAGMLWVIEKGRLGWNKRHANKRRFIDQAIRYFSIFDKSGRAYYKSRQTEIRSGTFENPTHIDGKWWDRLRGLVRRFLSGRVSDPHPDAQHFGGGCDVRRAINNHWIEVARYCHNDSKGREWCTYFWKVR